MVAIAIGKHDGRIGGVDAASGEIALVKSRQIQEAVAITERYASEDAILVSITRHFPDKLAFPLLFRRSEHHWLTNMVGDSRVSPTALGKLVSIVRAHAESGRKTVVFLEGVEYLIMENDFNSVLKALNQLCDLVISFSMSIVISVDPVALTQREAAMIERTCNASLVEGDYPEF